jgi:hypothetical protein
MLYPFELRARVESTGLIPPDVVETSGLCRFCAISPLKPFEPLLTAQLVLESPLHIGET